LQHFEGYLRCDDVEIAAISDVNPDAMRAAASHFGISPKMFDDYREMLTSVKLDAVSITIPDFLHAEAAVECAKAGVHILCEKPPALNAEQVRQMCEAAEAAGVKNMFHFNYHFHPPTLYVHRLASEGALGRLFHFRGHLFVERMSNPDVPLEWRMQREKGGYGALSDLGIHVLDRACLTLNQQPTDVESVSATAHIFIHERKLPDGGTGKVTAYDAAAFVLKFRNGALALGEVSRFSPGSNGFEVNGSKAAVRFDGVTGAMHFYEKRPTDHQRPAAEFNRIEVPEDFVKNIERDEFRYFIECIRRDNHPQPDFRYGLECQKVLDALDKSAREGRRIELTQGS